MTFDAKRLSPDKQREIIREFGDAGRDWVAGYPRRVEACLARWPLRLLGVAAAGLPINVIFYAEGAGGESLVLKLGPPHPEQTTEMIALAHYDGRFTPRLVDASPELGAILMERIEPGTTFRGSVAGSERSRVPLPIFGDLPGPSDKVADLPCFEDWLARAFAQFRHVFPRDHGFHRHVDEAGSVYAALRERHPDNWLLHGDLHHENILLDAERGWLAIDPKGVIGPKPIDCGRFLHNFLEDEIDGIVHFSAATIDQLCRVMEMRVATFEKMSEFTRRDLLQANYVDAVLSFCWTVNARPEYKDFQPVDAALALLQVNPR